MTERKYSISEIDRMRSALKGGLLSSNGGSYDSKDLRETTELQLRTHMLNGTSPDELESWSREQIDLFASSQC